jgi:hypothetical protein
VHNGTGGGGGAAAVLIINIGKLKKICFNAGLGGAAGQKSIDLNTNRHGSAGTDSTIVMTLPNGNTITARVGGGKGGLAYSSNAGAGREGGDGGAAAVTVESSTQIFSTATVSDSDLASVNYVGISTTGAKLSYPDTKSEALFYVLKVFGGGKGAADSALLSDAETNPIVSTSINVPFAPGVSHTIPALSKRSHTYANYITAGYDGGDGGYSLYGQGGLCSISYLPDVNSAIPLWTNASPPTGYGAGGSGDVFLVLVGKDGTKGGDGIIYILSANETTSPSQLTEILPYQSGILSPNAVQCLHLKVDDAIYDPENYSVPSFVACSYEYGSDGKTLMPALYATGINPVDWDNPYIYIGTKAILGTTYDAWQKIEANGIYNWTSSAKKIAYTNIIVQNNKFIKDLCNREGLHTTNTTAGIVVAPTCVKQGYTYSNCTECGYRFKGNYVPALGHSLGDWEVTIPPTLTNAGKQVKKCTRCNNIIESEIIPAIEPDIGTYEWLASGAVVQKYYVRTDSGAGVTEGAYEDITFVACGYLRNNDNIVTPVLYGTDLSVSPEPCLEDAFFYVGQEVLYGVTYDKWRKIELGGGNTYNWTSSSAYYVYTNVIVKNNRFIGDIYSSSIAGTVSIPWGVRAA